MNNKTQVSSKTKTIAVYSLLTAIMFIFTFTHLGYIKVGIAEITLMCLPLIFGINFDKIKAGLFFGFLFGLTSFLTCFGSSAFGSALFAISPLKCAALCFAPRILTGLFASLIFYALDKNKKTTAAQIILCVLTPLFNTLMFVSSFLVMFGKTDFVAGLMNTFGVNTLPALAVAAFALNAACEIAVCVLVGVPVCKALEKIGKRF